MVRNGGASSTSRSWFSDAACGSSSARRAATSALPSSGVRFIFQFPANSFLRMYSPSRHLRRHDEHFSYESCGAVQCNNWGGLRAFQSFDAREFNPFEVFERRAAASGNVREFIRPRLVDERRSRIAATNQTSCAAQVSHCLAYFEGALGELRNFKKAKWAIPN